MLNTTNRIMAIAACAAALTASGCSNLPQTAATDSRLSPAAGQAVVIGKFRLVKNGAEVNLGDGFLANKAVLHVEDSAGREQLSAAVGPNGEFTWALEPGSYQLSGIDFMVRGQRMNVDSRFEFDATSTAEATYVGTITLQTSFDSGYYGLNGVIDNYSIVDDCFTDCDGILARIGMPEGSAEVSLVRADEQLLSNNRPAAKATGTPE